MLHSRTGRILSNYCVAFLVTWSYVMARKLLAELGLYGEVQRLNFWLSRKPRIL
jgi:hypothetical protein